MQSVHMFASGGDMVGTELKGIKIVTSRYSINLDKTVKHFKPGLSYDLEVKKPVTMKRVY